MTEIPKAAFNPKCPHLHGTQDNLVLSGRIKGRHITINQSVSLALLLKIPENIGTAQSGHAKGSVRLELKVDEATIMSSARSVVE